MPHISYLQGGEDNAILDLQGNKIIGTIIFACPHCNHHWEMVIRRSVLNTQFQGFTWSLDDCTDIEGNPGAQIFRAYGYMECPSCEDTFFIGVEAHQSGAVLVYGNDPPGPGWWIRPETP
jgi:hypothetical protein